MIPYVLEVYVCKTDCIMYDPIDRIEKIFAYHNGDGRDVLIFPDGTRLIPGLLRGGKYTVSPKHFKKRN